MRNSRKAIKKTRPNLALKTSLHDANSPSSAETRLSQEELPNHRQILNEIRQKVDALCAVITPPAPAVPKPPSPVLAKPGLELSEVKALLVQLDEDTPFTASQLRICEAHGFVVREDPDELPLRRWYSPSLKKSKPPTKKVQLFSSVSVEQWLKGTSNPYVGMNFRLVPSRLPTSLRLQSLPGLVPGRQSDPGSAVQ